MNMAMLDPSHSGRSISESCLDPLGLGVTEAARALDIARQSLSRILDSWAGISPEIAIRLDRTG